MLNVKEVTEGERILHMTIGPCRPILGLHIAAVGREGGRKGGREGGREGTERPRELRETERGGVGEGGKEGRRSEGRTELPRGLRREGGED